MTTMQTRYFLVEEPDKSWSICDRHVVEAERDHRMVTGLREDHAVELLKKLNTPPEDQSS